jgi:hypothetical protein
MGRCFIWRPAADLLCFQPYYTLEVVGLNSVCHTTLALIVIDDCANDWVVCQNKASKDKQW